MSRESRFSFLNGNSRKAKKQATEREKEEAENARMKLQERRNYQPQRKLDASKQVLGSSKNPKLQAIDRESSTHSGKDNSGSMNEVERKGNFGMRTGSSESGLVKEQSKGRLKEENERKFRLKPVKVAPKNNYEKRISLEKYNENFEAEMEEMMQNDGEELLRESSMSFYERTKEPEDERRNLVDEERKMVRMETRRAIEETMRNTGFDDKPIEAEINGINAMEFENLTQSNFFSNFEHVKGKINPQSRQGERETKMKERVFGRIDSPELFGGRRGWGQAEEYNGEEFGQNEESSMKRAPPIPSQGGKWENRKMDSEPKGNIGDAPRSGSSFCKENQFEATKHNQMMKDEGEVQRIQVKQFMGPAHSANPIVSNDGLKGLNEKVLCSKTVEQRLKGKNAQWFSEDKSLPVHQASPPSSVAFDLEAAKQSKETFKSLTGKGQQENSRNKTKSSLNEKPKEQLKPNPKQNAWGGTIPQSYQKISEKKTQQNSPQMPNHEQNNTISQNGQGGKITQNKNLLNVLLD